MMDVVGTAGGRKGRGGGWPRGVMPCGVVLGVMLALAAPPADAARPPASAPSSSAAAAGGSLSPEAMTSFMAGRLAQLSGDLPTAATYLARVLAGDPDNTDLVRSLMLIDISIGQTADAVPLARRLVAGGDRNVVAVTLLALDAAAHDQFDAATQQTALLSGDPISAFFQPLLDAWFAAGRGDEKAALAALEPLRAQPGFQPMVALHTALIEDLTGHPDAARPWYIQATQGGGNWRAIALRVNFERRTGHPDAARALLGPSLGTSSLGNMSGPVADSVRALLGDAAAPPPPRMVASVADGLAEAMFHIASSLNQEARKAPQLADAALIYARLGLFMRPDHAETRFLIAEILAGRDKPEAALAEFDAVAGGQGTRGADGGNAGLVWMAGLRATDCLARLGRTDEAEHRLAAMLRRYPDQSDAVIRLGDLDRGANRMDAALAAYDKAVALVGPNPGPGDWFVFYGRAVVADALGHWDAAEADLIRALSLQPNEPAVLNYLGYSWALRGEKLDRAQALIQQALTVKPNDPEITDSLGWAKFRAGDIDGAITLLEKAAEHLSSNPEINEHLGDAYWAGGRTREARFQWRRAAQETTDDHARAVLEEKLRRETPAAAPPPPRDPDAPSAPSPSAPADDKQD